MTTTGASVSNDTSVAPSTEKETQMMDTTLDATTVTNGKLSWQFLTK
jgi:hypothetical protein